MKKAEKDRHNGKVLLYMTIADKKKFKAHCEYIKMTMSEWMQDQIARLPK